jgi:hypothetical protein
MVDDLLRRITQASDDDFINLWSWDQAEEEWLKPRLIVDDPQPSYLPWVNQYPASWRKYITMLAANDWQRLIDATWRSPSRIEAYQSHPQTRRRLAMPNDAHLRVGAIVWVFINHLWTTTECDIISSYYHDIFSNMNIPFCYFGIEDQDPYRFRFYQEPGIPGICSNNRYSLLYATVLSWFENANDVSANTLLLLNTDCRFVGCIGASKQLEQDYASSLATFKAGVSPWADPHIWLNASSREVILGFQKFTHSYKRLECEFSLRKIAVLQVSLLPVATALQYNDGFLTSSVLLPSRLFGLNLLSRMLGKSTYIFKSQRISSRTYPAFYRVLSQFMATLRAWETWDALTCLQNCRSMNKNLLDFLRKSNNVCYRFCTFPNVWARDVLVSPLRPYVFINLPKLHTNCENSSFSTWLEFVRS